MASKFAKTPVRVAWATALLSVALGVTIWSARSGAQLPDDQPPRARTILKNALELQKRTEYEAADRLYQQALAAKEELSPTERQDLAVLMAQNATALKGRRDGAVLVRQAQAALGQGRAKEAGDLLKAANANQYLAPGDRQALSRLHEQLRGSAPAASPAVSGANRNATTSVQTDIVVKDNDPKSYLAAARQALAKGEYDFAETLVKDAEQRGSTGWLPWGDSPAKVRREIQAARAKQQAPTITAQASKDAPSMMTKVGNALTPPWLRTNDKPAATEQPSAPPPQFPAPTKETQVKRPPTGLVEDLGPPVPATKTPGIDTALPTGPKLPPAEATAKARALIGEGYKALQVNDFEKARSYAAQAKALRPDLQWNEPNPDRLLAEVQRKSGAAAVSTAATGKGTPADAKNWLKQGRGLLQQDKIDEADQLCTKASSVTSARWGLFEDTPEKLRIDIQDARSRVNREKSKQLMADARKLFNQGKRDEAKALAQQAQQLHGPYSVWDFGDRPQKLLEDIARADVGGRKTPTLPNEKPMAPNSTVVAQNNAAPQLPGAGKNTPRPPANLINVSGTTQAASRLQANKMIAEARDLERRGLLVEARQKALEAETLGVAFGVDEDSPRNVMLSLSSKTDQRIKQLLAQATETLNTATDPARIDKAAAHVTAAQQLVVAFGLDPRPIEIHVQLVRQAAAKNNVISPIVAQGTPGSGLVTAGLELPTNPPVAGNRQAGLERLDQARKEIQAGSYTTARRLAEDAFNPIYGVQQEASAVLRTIDAEENLHQTTVAKRNYDAGLEAFHRRDFARAAQLWQAVDLRLLPIEKQRQLAELMQDVRNGGGVVQAKIDIGPVGGAPGHSSATDLQPSKSAFDNHLAMEEIHFQKLRERSLATMTSAMKLADDKKHAQAVETLKGFLDELKNAPINPDRVATLRRQVEAKVQQYSTLQAQGEMQSKLAQLNKSPETIRNEGISKLQQDVAELMKDARSKYKEGRYDQALAKAKLAKAMDGDNVAVDALIRQCDLKMTLTADARYKEENERTFLDALNRDQGPMVNMSDPLSMDKKVYDRASKRKIDSISWQLKDPVERAIQQKLEIPQSFFWKDTPLSQVIEDISKIANLNVHPDLLALKKEGVSLEMPMSLNVENVKLKSALNLLLSQAKLTYVIKDQVLQITTESEAKGKTKQVIHPVADLVVPVENHQTPEINSLNAALMRHINKNGNMNYGGPTPFAPVNGLPNNTGVPVSGGSMKDSLSSNPSSNGFMPNPNTKLLPGQTMEDLLIGLIKNTVAQNSWNDAGGPGAIQYYPLGMALVVNQTLEVQEEVAALLQALRRLQDLEVAIEMRLVSVSEAFFERMGLDFDINIRTPHSKGEQNLLSGQFNPFGSINRNLGVNGVVSGMTPAGTLTPDLNIPINNSSYNFTIPPFGGYPGTIGSDGGLSLGLAFLNDIQVFMFLEAAQGDRRTNVMQAPKITVFNGQVATMNIQDFQFFLTDVQIAVPGNGNQLFFVPNQAPYPLGISMTVSPVVSADRRFVRINLAPNLANLASATVPLFPVSIVVPQFFDGPGNNSSNNTQPTVFQMFFQQPTFTTISLNTTVNVPDGGTVLLGGLKTLSEARNEFGPPILSKIPYLSRLFRNIGYGREAQSLMIMVTPRIIINEEEEQILLGQVPAIPRP